MRGRLVGAAAFFIGYALVYVAVDYLKLPRPWFAPATGAWSFGASGAPRIGYFGQWLYALAGGGAAAAGARAWARRRPPGADALLLAALWVITAALVVGAYFTWQNWP